MNKNNPSKTAIWLLCATCLLPVILSVSGCNTVAPKPVTANAPSFDSVPDAKGNYQNSGILGYTNQEYIITETARERYNGLIAIQGKTFVPPVKTDAGITPYWPPKGAYGGATNLWLIDKAHVEDWAVMTAKRNYPASVKSPP